MGTKVRWTEKEVLQVRLLMEQGKSDEEIAAMLGRTRMAIRQKRSKAGLKREQNNKKWEKYELEFIRQYWRDTSDKTIAKKLRRTAEAVRTKRHEMGFRKDRYNKKGLRKSWSYDDEETVRRFYGRHSTKDIQQYLKGRHTTGSIRWKAREMGLRKDAGLKWGQNGLETIAEYYSRLKGN